MRGKWRWKEIRVKVGLILKVFDEALRFEYEAEMMSF
jgi:hypothetical protein